MRVLFAFAALMGLLLALAGLVDFGAIQFPDFRRMLAVCAGLTVLVVVRQGG